MSDLIRFAYADQPVRVVSVDGEPWFVASDITPILGYQHGPSAIRRLDADEYRSVPYALVDPTVRPGFGPQHVTVVSESGAYSLILWSQKEEAKPFRRWVTSEVLPSIRRHGGYLTPEATEAALTDPDFIIRLATSLKEERAARAAAEQEALTHRARLTLVEPKAAAFDRWMGSGAEYSIDVAAKALSAAGYLTGRNRLFLELAGLGWAYRDASGWHPYQAHGPEGTKRLAVRVFYYDHPETGEARGKTTLKITTKGIADLAQLHRLLPSSVHDVIEDAA